MPRETKELRSLVNASGFAFQLAVEAAVAATSGDHHWSVEAREHPWATAGSSGFIDLVLKNGVVHLVVECKRRRGGGDLVFLMPEPKQASRTHARLLWSAKLAGGQELSAWDDVQIDPGSPEVEFCVVEGQGEKNQPMLERIAAETAQAAEGLAESWLQLESSSDYLGVFVPVIVTTAPLYLCKLNPEEINLDRGEVDDAEFVQVQSVRFRKSLTLPDHSRTPKAERFKHLGQSAERTIFVVHAPYLPQWLESVSTGRWDGSFMPWHVAARRLPE